MAANTSKKRKISSTEKDNTTVSNVKVQYIRPKYNNLKEWTEDEQNVYIGRAGVVFVDGKRFPKHESKFANPFKIGRDGTRDKVLEKFTNHINDMLTKEPLLWNELMELKNKNLGCWCVDGTCVKEETPAVCHGQILMNLIRNHQTI